MSDLWNRPSRHSSDRQRRDFSGGGGYGSHYTDRHPSDPRWRLWHVVPALAILGLIVWGAW